MKIKINENNQIAVWLYWAIETKKVSNASIIGVMISNPLAMDFALIFNVAFDIKKVIRKFTVKFNNRAANIIAAPKVSIALKGGEAISAKTVGISKSRIMKDMIFS